MLTKTYAKVLDLGCLTGTKHTYVGMRDECIAAGGRRPPMTPDEFAEQLQARTFTNGKVDRPLVSALYKDGFNTQFARANSLIYGGLGWDDAACEAVVRVLRLGVCCNSLQRLIFDENQLSDVSACSLARLLGTLRFGCLEHLGLYRNSITDAGLAALKRTLMRHRKQTPQLKSLAVRCNLATPRAMQAFAAALARRGVEVDAAGRI